MFKHDSAFVWRPGRLYIPAMSFTGLTVGAINEGGAGNFAIGRKWANTGETVNAALVTGGIFGVQFDSISDSLDTDIMIPYDLDPQKNVYVRVVWTSGSTSTSDTITWAVSHQVFIPNQTQLSAATTALNKVIPLQNYPSTSSLVLCKTDWGIIAPDTISEYAEHWRFVVSLPAFSMAAAKYLLGLEIAYTPRRLYGGDGMLKPADFPVRTLSKQYS